MKIGQKLKNIKLIINDKTFLTENELTGKKSCDLFLP